jgi:hypothetical protein
MKEIELLGKYGLGKVALVDDEDFDKVNMYRWRVVKSGENLYAYTLSYGNQIAMHRLIMEPSEGMIVDHINRNGLDNTRNNLRICAHSENMRNRRKRKNSESQFIGVSRNRKGWGAEFKYKKKRYWVGTFDTQEEAARARDAKVLEFKDEFMSINFSG